MSTEREENREPGGLAFPTRSGGWAGQTNIVTCLKDSLKLQLLVLVGYNLMTNSFLRLAEEAPRVV